MAGPNDTNDEHPDWAELAEVAVDIEASYGRSQRRDPLRRRALMALSDLGAPVRPSWIRLASDPVRPSWIRLASDGRASFGDLTPEAFDKLVCLLEDLAARRPTNVFFVRCGPTLFDPGGPEGPAEPPPTSTVHLSIPG